VPYIPCPNCGVRTYSAATWSNTDHCPRCGRELQPRTRTLVPTAGPSQQLRRWAQIESATTALRHLRERSG
jgi:tRNA(Ile2) C34 agmatinyltransferase TiaS